MCQKIGYVPLEARYGNERRAAPWLPALWVTLGTAGLVIIIVIITTIFI